MEWMLFSSGDQDRLYDIGLIPTARALLNQSHTTIVRVVRENVTDWWLKVLSC